MDSNFVAENAKGLLRQIGNAVPPPFAEAIARQFNDGRTNIMI